MLLSHHASKESRRRGIERRIDLEAGEFPLACLLKNVAEALEVKQVEALQVPVCPQSAGVDKKDPITR